jgi:hypothetical protein
MRRNTMIKFFCTVVVASLLSGCAVVDPLFGSGEGTVVSVDRERGCLVTFRVKGQEKVFVSVADTVYKEGRCKRLQPEMTVPIVLDPIYGDYPYVLFEETGG